MHDHRFLGTESVDFLELYNGARKVSGKHGPNASLYARIEVGIGRFLCNGLCDRHRSGGSGHPPPIIALTANAFKEDQEDSRAAGMSDFMTKPMTMRPWGRAETFC